MVDQVIIAPAVEPLNRTEVKNHLRVDVTDDDTLIDALITTVRAHVETSCRRALVRQTRKWVDDCFKGAWIELPVAPLRAVESITYLDTDGTEQTWATTDYRVDDHSDTPRIEPAYGESWPSTRDVSNSVAIRYSAGYAAPVTVDTATDTFTSASHGLSDGDEVPFTNSGGALPTGLTAGTTYYVRDATADTFKVAATSGGAAIDITAAGTGTHFVGEVPAPIRQAMLLLIGHLYNNREAVTVGVAASELPMAVDALLAPYRVLRF